MTILNNYQLERRKPGKFPEFDCVLKKNLEYCVFLTVFQVRPVSTHLFFCWVNEEKRYNFDLL